MALIKGTSFDDVYWTTVLKNVQTILYSEFTYGKIYIAPEIQHIEPFTIRLWGPLADTEALMAIEWHKTYTVDVSIYSIEKNPTEKFYEQLYIDSERVYQSLFDNTTSTVGNGWWDGKVGSITYNEYEGNEAEIDGLQKISMDFTCVSGRGS